MNDRPETLAFRYFTTIANLAVSTAGDGPDVAPRYHGVRLLRGLYNGVISAVRHGVSVPTRVYTHIANMEFALQYAPEADKREPEWRIISAARDILEDMEKWEREYHSLGQ
jgi:hypothetical protein